MLYLVRQTQAEADYNQYTIAVFDDEQKALQVARTLNQKYGQGCIFDENWDFVEIDTGEDLHFYDVEAQKLNPDLNYFIF